MEATEPKKILLVADYGKDDLAFKEVQQRLYELAAQAGQRINVDIVSVDSTFQTNTAETAAVVAKAAAGGQYDVIYHNAAPRKDEKSARPDNDGEGLAYARYVTDGKKEVRIIGVNSGDGDTVNAFALLDKAHLPDGVIMTKSSTDGSQFRSRDVFPPHVIDAMMDKVALEDAPFVPPAPTDTARVAEAQRVADRLLAEAETQLSRHGDETKAYVTIVGRQKNAGSLLDNTATLLAGAEIDFLPLKSQHNEWMEAAFAAAQLAVNSTEGSRRTLIAMTGEQNNTLEWSGKLIDAKLDNGAHIITDDVRTLAFARERIAEDGVKEYQPNGRTFSIGDDGAVAIKSYSNSISSDAIARAAARPEAVTIAYEDGYGNMKLSKTKKELLDALNIGDSEGQTRFGAGDRAVVTVRVNGQTSEAFIAPQSFAVHDGELALSKGSSGWPMVKGGPVGDHNFAELFLRGGSAARSFSNPRPGDEITITLKEVLRGSLPGSVAGGVEEHTPVVDQARGA